MIARGSSRRMLHSTYADRPVNRSQHYHLNGPLNNAKVCNNGEIENGGQTGERERERVHYFFVLARTRNALISCSVSYTIKQLVAPSFFSLNYR